MYKSTKFSLLVIILLALSACTAAEYLIKRAINNFEGEFVKNFNQLAEFTPAQTLAIEHLASDTDQWMRKDRLTVVNSLTLLLATDIEQYGQIKSNHWDSVVNFLNTGLALSQAPDLVNQYAQFTMSLTEEQVVQVLKSFDDELNDSLKKSEDRTFEKQNKRIVDGLKWMFRAIGCPLTRKQKIFAKDFLTNRRVDFDYQRQIQIEETNELSEIVKSAQIMTQDQVYDLSLAFFKKVENTKSVPKQEDWQHNVDLLLQLINVFLADLNEKERVKAAIKMRDYATIFSKLSNQEK